MGTYLQLPQGHRARISLYRPAVGGKLYGEPENPEGAEIRRGSWQTDGFQMTRAI